MNRERIGSIMVVLGVLAWPLGIFILHWKAVPDTLILHLCLVIPGVYLRGSKILKLIKGIK